ncbi:MAG: L,D-transpeptidase [Beijerinckiaceae bacterium]|nr:L,D-transpeptidase [Beijerinckiaceae bacterium]
MSSTLSRRTFLVSAPLALAGCTAGREAPAVAIAPEVPLYYRNLYASIDTGPFPVPEPDLTEIDPKFYRQEVAYESNQGAGAIVVNTEARFLYLQRENGRAMRYGIGVGKEGLAFSGAGTIQLKREWPRWTPTSTMIAREPERYGPAAGGMEGGPKNPLGARALYLYRNGVDTLYRIHGTNEDWSIGQSISSGCIRLLNHDIIDLYARVPIGTRVVVLQRGGDRIARA